MRISDWSSDVCSSDLFIVPVPNRGEADASSLGVHGRESPASRSSLSRGSGGRWLRPRCAWSAHALPRELLCSVRQIGTASCRDRACQYESLSVVAVSLNNNILRFITYQKPHPT